eukprot:403349224
MTDQTIESQEILLFTPKNEKTQFRQGSFKQTRMPSQSHFMRQQSREFQFQGDEDFAQLMNIRDNESVKSGMSSVKRNRLASVSSKKQEIYTTQYNEREDRGFVIRELKPAKIMVDLNLSRPLIAQSISRRQSFRVAKIQSQISQNDSINDKINMPIYNAGSLNSSIVYNNSKDFKNEAQLMRNSRKTSSHDLIKIEEVPRRMSISKQDLIVIPEKRVQTQKPQARQHLRNFQQLKSNQNKVIEQPEVIIDLNQQTNIFNQDLKQIQVKLNPQTLQRAKKRIGQLINAKILKSQEIVTKQKVQSRDTTFSSYNNKFNSNTLRNKSNDLSFAKNFKIRKLSQQNQFQIRSSAHSVINKMQFQSNNLPIKNLSKPRDDSHSGDEFNDTFESGNGIKNVTKERNLILKRFFPTALSKSRYSQPTSASVNLTGMKLLDTTTKSTVRGPVQDYVDSPQSKLKPNQKQGEITYRQKMQRVIESQHQTQDLRKRFQDLSQNFDEARHLSKQSKSALDESLIKGFDNQLKYLEKLGVSQTKKQIQSKALSKLLNETSHMSAMISAIKFQRFKEEMVERKQSLAFKLQKIYFVQKHSQNVYHSLLAGKFNNKVNQIQYTD